MHIIFEDYHILVSGTFSSPAMEPIAVIGLDLKFPGDATDADGFSVLLSFGPNDLQCF